MDVPPIVEERLELIWTIVMDAFVIVAAVAASAAVLWVTSAVGGERWAIVAVTWIADIGFVGAAFLMTGFDLAKRLKRGFRSTAADA